LLDVVNALATGFVAIPVLQSCARRGLFNLLEKNPGLAGSAIAFHLGGNEGHIRVALRLLYELGCLDGGEEPGGYTLTPQSTEFRQLPGEYTRT